jgi:hypothetical protein
MSVIADFQVNGLNPSVVSAASSGIQYFPRLLGASIGVQSVAPSATSAAGQLVVPGNNELNGQWFDVYVGAEMTPGAAQASVTATLELVANTGTVTSPTYTSLASTGAVDIAPSLDVPAIMGIKASLLGTTGSGVVGGTYSALFNNTLENSSPKVLTAALSGVNFGLANPFGLVVRVTFSTASSTNIAKLFQFQIAAQ